MPERPREITLRFLAGASDMNIYGKVHGGAVMKWIDEAAYACAAGWSGRPCVTVYVGGIQFHRSVLVGHVVEVYARLIYTGHTSMHISVDVSTYDPRGGEKVQTTRCITVFVAIDDAGHPVAISTWTPVSAEDVALHDYAYRLMELRRVIEQEAGRPGGGATQSVNTASGS
jgi:acyl-CoA hydrolase